jgi:hypothetical protein
LVIVIKGPILSIDEGSAAKCVAIGFGSAASQFKAAAEGYLMTDRGLRKLGSGTTNTSVRKSPGEVLGVVGAIATANPVRDSSSALG